MNVLEQNITRRCLLMLAGAAAGSKFLWPVFASEVVDVPAQPYFAGVSRALDAMAKLGAPILAEDARQLADLSRQNDPAAVEAAEEILDRYTLMRIVTEPDGMHAPCLGTHLHP